MRKLVLLGLIVCNLFAIGGMSTLPDDEKKVAQKIQDTLNINQKDAFMIYSDYFQSYLNESDWQLHFGNNATLSSSKVQKAQSQTMFVSLINPSRIINFSIVTFPKQSQVLIYTIETLPRKSSTVIDKFNDLEKDKKFIKERETDAFAYFSKDGYTKKINIFVSSPVGAIQYTNLYVESLTN